MAQRVLTLAAVLTVFAGGCGGDGGTTGDADAGDAAHEVDASMDPAADPAADPASDPGHDPAADPDPEVPADGRCPAMTASFTSMESWVICWMGTGTAVSFTLQYRSPTTACPFTNVTVTAGSLDLVSSATSIMSWGTVAPTSGFSGTVPAGGTASATYFVNDTSLDSSAHDGASVTVTAEVSYDTPTSTQTLTVTSSPSTHTCVY